MTFYIPPVFLFGNKVRHIRNNQEKNKAEYKTATETGIQIENRNIKRIEKLEKENTELKEHKENLIWLDKMKEEKKSEYKEWLLAILICLLLSLPCIVASILQEIRHF